VTRRPRRSAAEAVALAAARAPDCGFFLDFDGTLAPIEEDPDAVRPVPGAVAALAALASAVGRVEIVSARPAAFLADRLRAAGPLTLHGLYGLEVRRGAGEVVTDPAAAPWIPVVAEVTERARREQPDGVRVEHKRLSVALHYRGAPGRAAEVLAWAGAEAARHGLGVQRGRMVVELRPPGRRDKGDVVRGELDGLACAWYAGDDVADLDAFRALTEREAAGDGFAGVRVAVANPESGAALAAEADIVLRSPAEVPDLLNRVVRAVEARRR